MMAVDTVAKIIVIVHAYAGIGKGVPRDTIVNLLVISDYIFSDKSPNESNFSAHISNIHVIIDMLTKNGFLIPERDNELLFLSDKGVVMLRDIISSEKIIKLWKLVKYLSKFSAKTISELASHILSVTNSKHTKNTDTDAEINKILVDLLDALRELVRKDKIEQDKTKLGVWGSWTNLDKLT